MDYFVKGNYTIILLKLELEVRKSRYIVEYFKNNGFYTSAF